MLRTCMLEQSSGAAERVVNLLSLHDRRPMTFLKLVDKNIVEVSRDRELIAVSTVGMVFQVA